MTLDYPLTRREPNSVPDNLRAKSLKKLEDSLQMLSRDPAAIVSQSKCPKAIMRNRFVSVRFNGKVNFERLIASKLDRVVE